MISRRKLLLGSVLPVTAGYASFVEPVVLRSREMKLIIPSLPSKLDGLKVAQLTDFHYHPYEKGFIERAVRKAMDWQPDLIVLTGDFIDKSENNLEALLEVLAPLQAQYGVYAVLGNHDHYHLSVDECSQIFARTKIKLLVNEVERVAGIELIGLDSVYSSIPDYALPVGTRASDTLRIVLSHEPDTFDDVRAAYMPHLQLSGHTHGGQCRVPLFGYAPFTPLYGKVYRDGLFQKEQSQLFVSSGLGTSVVRMRFACLPEVALLTLRTLEEGS